MASLSPAAPNHKKWSVSSHRIPRELLEPFDTRHEQAIVEECQRILNGAECNTQILGIVTLRQHIAIIVAEQKKPGY
jgi:hypothetical protein